MVGKKKKKNVERKKDKQFLACNMLEITILLILKATTILRRKKVMHAVIEDAVISN